MGTRARATVIAFAVAIVLCVALPASAGAASASDVRCGSERDTGRRVCFAPSNAFPQAQGWHGYVMPGSPCNGGPFEGYWQSGVVGICSVRSYPAWKRSGRAWTRTTVVEGTTGYVHPYANGWRWLYVSGTGWMAIRSADLGLRWYDRP